MMGVKDGGAGREGRGVRDEHSDDSLFLVLVAAVPGGG